MKKGYKISLTVIAFILLFILLVLTLPKLFQTGIKTNHPITELAKYVTTQTPEDSYSISSAHNDEEKENFGLKFSLSSKTEQTAIGFPIINGTPLYCVQHGVPINYTGHFEFLRDDYYSTFTHRAGVTILILSI